MDNINPLTHYRKGNSASKCHPSMINERKYQESVVQLYETDNTNNNLDAKSAQNVLTIM